MRFVNDKIHGVIDYVAAFALIAVPFILNFQAVSPFAHWFSVVAGVGLFVYSLITNYTFSAKGVISFGLHLILDVIAGAAFIALPFILGFSGNPRIFYLASGAAVVILVLLTDPNVGTETQESEATA